MSMNEDIVDSSTTSTSSPSPDVSSWLAKCAPSELTAALLQHRCDGNHAEAREFLVQAQKTLRVSGGSSAGTTTDMSATTTTTTTATTVSPMNDRSASKNDNDDNDDNDNDRRAFDWGAPLLQQPRDTPQPLLCTLPSRCGKITLDVYEEGLQAFKWTKPAKPSSAGGETVSDSKNTTAAELMWSLHRSHVTVEYLLVVPKPQDVKQHKRNSSKPISYLAVLLLKAGSTVSFKNKDHSQVCFSLPEPKPTTADKEANEQQDKNSDEQNGNRNETSTDKTSATALQLQETIQHLVDAVKPENEVIFVDAKAPSFVSYQDDSTTTSGGGLPFVSCFRGTTDGVLFFTPAGLLFVNQPGLTQTIFLPAGDIQRVEQGGRGAAGGGGRYMDLTLQVARCFATVAKQQQETRIEFTNIYSTERDLIQDYLSRVVLGHDEADSDDDSSTMEQQKAEEEAYNATRRRLGKRKASQDARRQIRKRLSQDQPSGPDQVTDSGSTEQRKSTDTEEKEDAEDENESDFETSSDEEQSDDGSNDEDEDEVEDGASVEAEPIEEDDI